MSARSHPDRRAALATGDDYFISSDLASFEEICALAEGSSEVRPARVRVQESGQGQARVELYGEFDAGVITALRRTLEEVLSSANDLLIDLSGTALLAIPAAVVTKVLVEELWFPRVERSRKYHLEKSTTGG